MKLNYNLKSLLPIMFHDILISLTVLMYPCNVWINFMMNFFTKISSTNQCGNFFCIFTLSHGQSQVERGFSINKEIVIENLHSSSLSTNA